MEKACKIAHTKLWIWKISTQNMCKNAQNLAKFAKMPKIAQKRPKIFHKIHEKTKQKVAQLWKISTLSACAACIFFHICSRLDLVQSLSLSHSLSHTMNQSLIDSLTHWLSDSLTQWLSDSMNQWITPLPNLWRPDKERVSSNKIFHLVLECLGQRREYI